MTICGVHGIEKQNISVEVDNILTKLSKFLKENFEGKKLKAPYLDSTQWSTYKEVSKSQVMHNQDFSCFHVSIKARRRQDEKFVFV